MDEFSLAFMGANVLFAALFAGIARLLLGRRGSPILWAFILVTVVFVYLLPAQEYSVGVDFDVLLLAHLLLLAYLSLVLLIARAGAVTADTLVRYTQAVSARAIAAALLAWAGVRMYLLVVYGPAALMFSRSQVVQSTGFVEFATWEVALASITTMLLMGVFVTAVIRHAAGVQGQWKFVTLVMAASLVLVVVTNESPIGSRRLLLVLAAVWLSVAWALSVARHRKGRLVRVTAMAALVAGIAVYYQYVRHNDFSEILAARNASEAITATLKFATTIAPQDVTAEVRHLRAGPFDFFSKVIDVGVVDGKSSGGDATAFSIAVAVPKPLYPGEKPVGDVDQVLLDTLDIMPTTPFLTIDYPTSLAAIAAADFGPAGIIPAALVLGTGFAIFNLVIKRVRHSPAPILISLGVAVQLIGSQEMGLTAMLTSFRDAAIALLVLLPCGWLVRQVRQPLARWARRTRTQEATRARGGAALQAGSPN